MSSSKSQTVKILVYNPQRFLEMNSFKIIFEEWVVNFKGT